MYLINQTRNETLQNCKVGCLACDGVNCLVCDFFQGFKPKDESCTINTYQGCKQFNLDGSCRICGKNEYPGNFTCLPLLGPGIPNCETYHNEQECLFCLKDFFLSQDFSSCSPVKIKIANCQNYGMAESECLICASNYQLSLDQKSCIKQTKISNCSSYSTSQCEVCRNDLIFFPMGFGQFFYENSGVFDKEIFRELTSVLPSTLKIPFQCVSMEYIENCLTYKDPMICSICHNGFYPNEDGSFCDPLIVNSGSQNCLEVANNDCQKCFEGYELDFLCKKIAEIKNCEFLNQEGRGCLACKRNFYSHSGECFERQNLIKGCSDYQFDEDRCAVCGIGKILIEKICVEKIENCKIQTQTTHCDICENTYIPVENTCQSGKIKNCLEYNSMGECEVCNSKFYSNLICHKRKIIKNCQDPMINENKCKICSEGFTNFIMENKCKKILIKNCLEMTTDGKNCGKCKEKYQIGLDGKCQLISESPLKLQNCLEVDEFNQWCVRCDKKYVVAQGHCVEPLLEMTANCQQIEEDEHGAYCRYCKKSTIPLNFIQNNIYLCERNFNEYKNFAQMNLDRNSIANSTAFFYDSIYKCEYFNGNICQKCADGYERFYGENECYLVKEDVFSPNIVNLFQIDNFIQINGYQISDFCQFSNPKFVDTHSVGCFSCKPSHSKFISENSTSILTLDPVSKKQYNYFKNEVECRDISQSPQGYLVENCEYYFEFDDGYFGCVKCEHGYTDGKIEGCQVYNQEYECEICHIGWTFSKGECLRPDMGTCYEGDHKGATQCEKNPNDCKIYNGETKTCLICKSGFVRETIQTGDYPEVICQPSLYSQFIQICVQDTNCKDSFRYLNLHAKWERFFSCQKCKNSKQIPFISLNSISQIQRFSINIDETLEMNTNDQGKFQQCIEPKSSNFNNISPFNFPSNCALGVLLSDHSPSTEGVNASIKCVACLPGFKPNFDSNDYVTECDAISACKKKIRTLNGCDEKPLNYIYTFDAWNESTFDTFVEFKKDKYCLFAEPNGSCQGCIQGYHLLFGACLQPILLQCKEYGTNFDQFVFRNHFIFNNFYKGCKKCNNGYQNLNFSQQNQCLGSSGDLNNLSEDRGYVLNCDFFDARLSSLDQLICGVCKKGYVLQEGGEKCLKENINIKNCVLAINSFQCQECGPDYIMMDNVCLKKTNKNCKTYVEFELDCQECEEKFVLTFDLKCEVIKAKNCIVAEMGDPLKCLKCQKNYVLIEINNVTSCQKLDSNCDEYGIPFMNKISCQKCKSGYYADEQNQADLESFCFEFPEKENCSKYNELFDCVECKNKFYLLGDLCEPRTIDENCIEYDQFSDWCLTCTTGYYFNFDKCEGINDGVPNCLYHKTKDTCAVCEKGFKLSRKGCLKVESTDENCLLNDSRGKCEFCKIGYLAVSGKCKLIQAENCLTFKNETSCSSCILGFKFPDSSTTPKPSLSKSCSVKFEPIDFCIANDIEGICTECEENTELDQNKQNCYGITNGISNCLVQSSPLVCTSCEENYVLTESGSCILPIRCSDGILTESGECIYPISCPEGEHFTTIGCVQPFSCPEGQIYTTEGCIEVVICQDGYFLIKLGVCFLKQNCPECQVLVDGKCTETLTCPEGQIFTTNESCTQLNSCYEGDLANSNNCPDNCPLTSQVLSKEDTFIIPITCPQGQVQTESGCVTSFTCPSGSQNTEAGICWEEMDCQENEFYSNKQFKCVSQFSCLNDEVMTESGTCVPIISCKFGEIQTKQGCYSLSGCSTGEVLTSQGCKFPIICSEGEFYAENQVCIKEYICQEGYVMFESGCVKAFNCPKCQIQEEKGKCVQLINCPDGTIYTSKGTCIVPNSCYEGDLTNSSNCPNNCSDGKIWSVSNRCIKPILCTGDTVLTVDLKCITPYSCPVGRVLTAGLDCIIPYNCPNGDLLAEEMVCTKTQSCSENYVLTDQGCLELKKEPINNQVGLTDTCLVYKEQSEAKCSSCSQGYYLNNSFQCIQNPQDPQKSCLIYNFKLSQCLICGSGFYMDETFNCIKNPGRRLDGLIPSFNDLESFYSALKQTGFIFVFLII